MAPGSLVANIIAISGVSHFNFIEAMRNQDADSSNEPVENKFKLLLSWVYNIYVHERLIVKTSTKKMKKKNLKSKSKQKDSKKIDQIKKVKSIRWMRILVTLLLCTMNVFQYWIFILGYYYGKQASINNGVVMSMYSLKTVLTPLLFFIFFGQRIKIYDILGLLL